MKRILILIIGLIGVAQAQYSPTSAKSRFVNGLALGTKLDSYFNAADSNAIYWRADSSLMAKYKGTARALAFAVSGGYLPISDTASMLSKYFRTTTQLNDTTFVINRPDATADTIQLSFLVPDTTGKLSIIDTSAMLAPYRRTSTLITNSDLTNSTISGIALGSNLNNLTAGNGLSGTAYNGGTAYTWQVDTSTISTKANVTGALVAKVNYTDTAAMLSGYKTYYPRTAISAGTGISYNAATGVITNSSPSSGGTVTSVATNNGSGITGGTITSTGTIAADTTILSTKANVTGALVGYTTTGRFLDSLTNVQARIQTKQPLGNYLTFADSSTMLAGRWLPNRSADSIAVIRALANTKQPIGNYITFADSTTILAGRWLPNRSADSTAVLRALINTKGTGNGTVTSIATNTGTGITGGTITSTGTIAADTTILSTKANVTGTLVGYTATGRFLDSLTNVQSRIQTKQPLGNYLTFADSTTILAGRWLPNRSADSIAVIRALANSKGTGSVTSVATGVGLSGGTITTSGTISADTTTLSTRAYVTGQLVGYATTGNLALKFNISDTAAMMSKSFRTTTQVNDTTFTINRPDGTKDTIALSVQVPSTSQLVYNTALTTDADYSLGLSDTYVQLVSTSTPRTLTLPAASTCQGRVVILNSKVGGGSGWTSTQTIYTTYPTTGGVTSLNGSVDTIISNGTNWIFITRY